MKQNPKWIRIMTAALSLVGLSSFKMKENKLDLTPDQRARLATSFGEKFPEALEKHLSQTGAGATTDDAPMSDDDFRALTTHLMTEAMSNLQAEADTLRTELQEARTTINAQRQAIETLSASAEDDLIPLTKPKDPNAVQLAAYKPDMTLLHNKMWKAQQDGLEMPTAEATLSIDGIKTEFGKFSSAEKKTIIKKLTAKTETMQYMTSVQTSDSVWKAAQASMSHVVQQFIAAWTPLGKASFTPISIPVRHHKINVPIVPAEVIDTWLAHLYDESKSPDQMPLVRFILDLIIDKAQEDRELLQVMTGEYVEYQELPADGTPGQSPEKAVDGLLTILRKQYEDPNTRVHFVPLGEITEANIVDKMKQFRRSLPRELLRKPMDVLISEDLRGMYKDAYQTLFPNTKNEDENKDRLDHSQLRLAPVASLGGLKSFFVTPKDNLILLRGKNEAGKIMRLDFMHYKVFVYGEYTESFGLAIQEAVVAYIDPFWVLDGYAKNDDASRLLVHMLTDAGCEDVNPAKLAGYKTAIAAAAEITDLTTLQAIVDTVNAA